MALVGQFGWWRSCYSWCLPTPRWPDDWWIVERRKVIVFCFDHCDCEGLLCLPRRSAKSNFSGLRVSYGSSSCVGCVAPGCGLGVWCLLAREPPSEWIAITGTSLPASKWSSKEKSLCLDCLLGILGIHCDWSLAMPVYHLYQSLALLCVFTCVELVVVVASSVASVAL